MLYVTCSLIARDLREQRRMEADNRFDKLLLLVDFLTCQVCECLHQHHLNCIMYPLQVASIESGRLSLSIFLMMFDLIWSVDMNMNRFMARRAVLFRAHLSVRNVFGNDFYSLLPPMQHHYAFMLRERGDWVKKKSNCARHFFLQEIDLFSFHVVADCVTIRRWAPTVCTHETRRERPARGWHICHSR